LLLAAALRLPALGDLPTGLFLDEASVGVNARLIARAGIDQYGESLPVFFRALDDYKCGLFLYSAAPFLVAGPPTARAVRLPAALWGLLAVLVAFFLARELYDGSDAAGLWAALFLAVTPWHVHFSRIAWQAIVLTVVYPAAVLFVLRWLRTRRSRDAFLAGLLCALSLYAYTVAKLLVAATVLAVVYALIRIRARPRDRDPWIFAAALAVAAAPFTIAYLGDHAAINLRFGAMLLPPLEALGAYLSHLSPGFLWLTGDANLRHSPGVGLLPPYLAPLLILGAVDLLRRRGPALALLGLLLFVPSLGALSEGYPHATRTLIWQPFLQIVAAGGLLAAGRFLERRGLAVVWSATRATVALALVVSLAHSTTVYAGPYRERSAAEWRAGLVPALREAARLRLPREDVLMRTDSGHYAYWMFVTDPPPERILANRERVSAGSETYDHLDRGNKYGFLGFRTIAQGRGTVGDHPGLWVLPRAAIDAGRLRELEQRGAVESLYGNDAYLVLRVGAPSGSS
jgi:4-amino-4-deoxy-L-arabinose transferase-like glycosyltransferase